MSQKAFWSWFAVIGFIIMIIGSFTAIIPIIGLPLMAIGTIMMIIGIVGLIPILIKERKKDYNDMRSEISEEELRP